MTQIALVGEAYGEHEERQRSPFVGPAGYELTRMLSDAGIARSACFLTNVFNMRPANNDIETLCGPKADGIPGRSPLRPNKFVRKEFGSELDRLERELSHVRPNITVVLGNTALWALLGGGSIGKLRGTISVTADGRKVLPTYHPAAILRGWENRPVTVLDLAKAKRESLTPHFVRPARRIYIEPTIQDILHYWQEEIRPASHLAVDIETMQEDITCIGFAPSISSALVIPFMDLRRGGNYWETFSEEKQAWATVRAVLTGPQTKIFQNGLYDVHFLWRRYGIPVNNMGGDSMLLHHALQPESEKGLGFLGSVYTNEPAWKSMRTQTIKRDE